MNEKEETLINELNPREGNGKILNRVLYTAGRTIIEQGDEGHRAYYIESGHVEVLVKDGAHELKVSELGPGEIFGEMALINSEPRSATVKAIDAVTVSVVSNEEIETKIDKLEDKAVKALIKVLVKRLRHATQGQMDHYKSLSDFQDRVTGLVDQVDIGIGEKDRAGFREEVEPLLEELQKVLNKYGR